MQKWVLVVILVLFLFSPVVSASEPVPFNLVDAHYTCLKGVIKEYPELNFSNAEEMQKQRQIMNQFEDIRINKQNFASLCVYTSDLQACERCMQEADVIQQQREQLIKKERLQNKLVLWGFFLILLLTEGVLFYILARTIKRKTINYRLLKIIGEIIVIIAVFLIFLFLFALIFMFKTGG